jgi:glycine cleavage system H protein
MGKWKTPADLKYAKTDEWLRIEGDTATIGISDYAQDALNDLVFIELPEVGAKLTKGESFGVVESVKAASDLNAPISGTVTAVNSDLEDQPELMNSDPYGKAWIVKLKINNASEANDLMDSAAYDTYCETR